MADTMIDRLLDTVASIAPQLRNGEGSLIDPDCLEKLNAERQEWKEAWMNCDPIGALMERADCLYYIGKAVHNGLVSLAGAEQLIREATEPHSPSVILRIMQAKYQSRIKYGKDDRRERFVVSRVCEDYKEPL